MSCTCKHDFVLGRLSGQHPLGRLAACMTGPGVEHPCEKLLGLQMLLDQICIF